MSINEINQIKTLLATPGKSSVTLSGILLEAVGKAASREALALRGSVGEVVIYADEKYCLVVIQIVRGPGIDDMQPSVDSYSLELLFSTNGEILSRLSP